VTGLRAFFVAAKKAAPTPFFSSLAEDSPAEPLGAFGPVDVEVFKTLRSAKGLNRLAEMISVTAPEAEVEAGI
jgi:hypothetical protein